MKKRLCFVVLLCMAVFATSCGDGEPTPTIEISNGATQVTLSETVPQSTTVSFTSSSSWQITTSDTRAVPSWLDVSPESGGAGTHVLTISAKEENTGLDDRNGYIKISSGDVYKYVTVTQKKKDFLQVTQSLYNVDANGDEITVEVKANVAFTVDILDPEWIHRTGTFASAGSKLHFTIDANEEVNERSGKIVLSNGELEETITLKQGVSTYYISTDYSADGKVTTLQRATAGNGIDIVLMGDAFSDRLITDGTYEKTMYKAMEYCFTEEPFKSFRSLFNVYMVNVVSKNEVYKKNSSTALEGYFGDGTLVGGNDRTCFGYAQNVLTESRMNDALIIVVMNSTNYAGTCYMYYPAIGDYSRGTSVAYLPVGEDDQTFEELINHEACGHGFSKLADEYAYLFNGAMPDNEINSHRQLELYGWWKNVDFTNITARVKWAKFLSDARYAQEGLGIYEGACTYWTKAYRPTFDSIMRYNTGGFNAPSREAIYYRIHKLAYGEAWIYDYERFVSYDAVNRAVSAAARREQAARSASRANTLNPTTPPVIIKHSWRGE